MASDLAAHALPSEAAVIPERQGEAAPEPAGVPMAPVGADPRHPNPEGPQQMEYANPGGPSRLHELLTPSQAQALGEYIISNVLCYLQ